LLAAAHAACYVTSLAGEIARAGGTVERIDLTCTVTMDEVGEKGHLIVASEIDARARAEGIDAAGLEQGGAGRRRRLSVLGADPGERFG
jgi:organic hydroperoxide reductase OsmC/OhrA